MTESEAEVLEVAKFGVAGGADPAAVRGAAAGLESWLASQPGFRARTLIGPDGAGRYTDLVRWRSLADAKAAMAAMESEPSVGPFMALIDPATVEMDHVPVLHTS